MRTLGYLSTVALLCVLAVPAAMADAPNWTYVEAGYTDVDIDNVDDGDGWFVGASFGSEWWHVFGRYVDQSTDDQDLDVTRWHAGLGWHGLLGERADVVAEVAYVDAEIEPVDDTGYFGRAGVRWRPIQLFEVGAFARFEDLGDLNDDVVWEANAMIHVWRVSIGIAGETQDDIDTYNAFARFNFSGR